MPVCDVNVLSESEGDGDVIPEPPAPPPVSRKGRKRSFSDGEVSPTHDKTKMDPATRLRQILGVRCKCKKRDCLREFAEDPVFQQLKDYRSSYFNLHKLDQDHFVAYPLLADLCSFHDL